MQTNAYVDSARCGATERLCRCTVLVTAPGGLHFHPSDDPISVDTPLSLLYEPPGGDTDGRVTHIGMTVLFAAILKCHASVVLSPSVPYRNYTLRLKDHRLLQQAPPGPDGTPASEQWVVVGVDFVGMFSYHMPSCTVVHAFTVRGFGTTAAARRRAGRGGGAGAVETVRAADGVEVPVVNVVTNTRGGQRGCTLPNPMLASSGDHIITQLFTVRAVSADIPANFGVSPLALPARDPTHEVEPLLRHVLAHDLPFTAPSASDPSITRYDFMSALSNWAHDYTTRVDPTSGVSLTGGNRLRFPLTPLLAMMPQNIAALRPSYHTGRPSDEEKRAAAVRYFVLNKWLEPMAKLLPSPGTPSVWSKSPGFLSSVRRDDNTISSGLIIDLPDRVRLGESTGDYDTRFLTIVPYLGEEEGKTMDGDYHAEEEVLHPPLVTHGVVLGTVFFVPEGLLGLMDASLSEPARFATEQTLASASVYPPPPPTAASAGAGSAAKDKRTRASKKLQPDPATLGPYVPYLFTHLKRAVDFETESPDDEGTLLRLDLVTKPDSVIPDLPARLSVRGAHSWVLLRRFRFMVPSGLLSPLPTPSIPDFASTETRQSAMVWAAAFTHLSIWGPTAPMPLSLPLSANTALLQAEMPTIPPASETIHRAYIILLHHLSDSVLTRYDRTDFTPPPFVELCFARLSAPMPVATGDDAPLSIDRCTAFIIDAITVTHMTFVPPCNYVCDQPAPPSFATDVKITNVRTDDLLRLQAELPSGDLSRQSPLHRRVLVTQNMPTTDLLRRDAAVVAMALMTQLLRWPELATQAREELRTMGVHVQMRVSPTPGIHTQVHLPAWAQVVASLRLRVPLSWMITAGAVRVPPKNRRSVVSASTCPPDKTAPRQRGLAGQVADGNLGLYLPTAKAKRGSHTTARLSTTGVHPTTQAKGLVPQATILRPQMLSVAKVTESAGVDIVDLLRIREDMATQSGDVMQAMQRMTTAMQPTAKDVGRLAMFATAVAAKGSHTLRPVTGVGTAGLSRWDKVDREPDLPPPPAPPRAMVPLREGPPVASAPTVGTKQRPLFTAAAATRRPSMMSTVLKNMSTGMYTQRIRSGSRRIHAVTGAKALVPGTRPTAPRGLAALLTRPAAPPRGRGAGASGAAEGQPFVPVRTLVQPRTKTGIAPHTLMPAPGLPSTSANKAAAFGMMASIAGKTTTQPKIAVTGLAAKRPVATKPVGGGGLFSTDDDDERDESAAIGFDLLKGDQTLLEGAITIMQTFVGDLEASVTSIRATLLLLHMAGFLQAGCFPEAHYKILPARVLFWLARSGSVVDRCANQIRRVILSVVKSPQGTKDLKLLKLSAINQLTGVSASNVRNDALLRMYRLGPSRYMPTTGLAAVAAASVAAAAEQSRVQEVEPEPEPEPESEPEPGSSSDDDPDDVGLPVKKRVRVQVQL